MARASTNIDQILADAVSSAIRRVSPAIQRQLAAVAAEELEKSLAVNGVVAPAPARRSRPRREMTRWVADRNARRVPIFVIEATGLDTKKKIVARYGPDVAFERGKPLPKPLKGG